MSDIDLDGALDALSAELPDDYEDVPEVSNEAVVEDNQQDAESFTGFDPNVLPEDMQKVYKSMQADYTRKTQEVAQIRQQYESLSEHGVDPNEALEAVNLLQRMNNDPNFAASVAQDIQNRLEELGYADNPVMDDTSINDNESYGELPPQLMRELEEMRMFRQSMMEQQQQSEILQELDIAEQTIRSTNPDYTDDDMQSIYSLAYATDGDLMAAADQYHAIQQRLLGNYLQAKTVPHGATPAPGGPTSTPDRDFGTDLDAAHKAAMELIRNAS